MSDHSFTKAELREELHHFGKTVLSTQLQQIIHEQLEEYFKAIQISDYADNLRQDRSLNSFGFANSAGRARRTRNSTGVKDMSWLKFALTRGNWDNTVSTVKKAVKARRPTWLNAGTDYKRSEQQGSSNDLEQDDVVNLERHSSKAFLTAESRSSRQSRHSNSSEHHRRRSRPSDGFQRLLTPENTENLTISRASSRQHRSGQSQDSASRHDSQKVKFHSNGVSLEDDIDEEESLIGPLATVLVRPSIALSPDSARDMSSVCSDNSRSSGGFVDSADTTRSWTCRGFVQSNWFDYCAAGISVVSSVIIGVQTNYMASHCEEDIPLGFFINQSIFSGIFVCEMAVRLVFNHPSGHDWEHPAGWRNLLFDFVVLGMELFREIVHYSFAFSGHRHRLNFSILPLRMLRFTIIVPSRELHQLSVSFLESFRYLICAMMIIFIMTFLSGIFFTEYVIFLKVWHPSLELEEEKRLELNHHFGTVPRAMIALFQVVSDGIHWHELADPLIASYSEWVVLPFILYAALAIYSLMNIIVGIFVDSAVRTADTDNKVSLIQEMHAMFQLADEDGSGTLSWDEFERFLDHPQMCKLLRAIDLDQDHARQLFRLLDEDQISGNHEINHKTFVNRCMRFHGAAKAVDLAAFMHEYQRTMKIVMDYLEDMEQFMSLAASKAA